MENDLKKHLLTIARVLNKYFALLNNNYFEDFKNNIDSYSLDELTKFSCAFLNIAILNYGVLILLKKEFAKIYDIYTTNHKVCEKHNNDFYPILKNNLFKNSLLKNNNGLYLDSYFTKDSMINEYLSELEVLISNSNKHYILSALYEIGADIMEPDDFDGSEALITFDDNLKLKIYFYELRDNNLVFSKQISDNRKRKYIFSKDMIKLGYKYDRGNYYETNELKYLSLILGGSDLDYIQAFNFIGKINIKKIKKLKEEIKYYDEELEVKHGLQKTSRFIIS